MKKEDFIPGKWYRSTPEANNRGGEIYYGKFLEFRGDAFIASSSRVSGMISDIQYSFSSGYIWELLTDLSEIQDFLPTNHPDKLMKTATVSTSPAYVRCTHSHDNRFKKGKVYKTHPGVYKQGNIYIKPEIDSPISDYPLMGGYWQFEPCEGPETSETEVFGKFIIGDIVVSLRNNEPYREEGDMFRVLPDSKQDVLYYKPSTNSQHPDDWRLATSKECDAFNNGVKNIKQLEEPKETVVKHAIPSNAKKWAVRCTEANCMVLNEWANKQGGYGHSSTGGWIHSINYGGNGHSGHGHFYADDTKHPDHTEISFETFEREYLKSTPNTNVEPVITKAMNTDKWCIEMDFNHPDKTVIIDYMNKKYQAGMTGSGGYYYLKDGKVLCNSAIPPGYEVMSIEQFKRDIMKVSVVETPSKEWHMLVTSENRWEAELWRWDGNPRDYKLELGQLIGVSTYGSKGHNPGNSPGVFGRQISYAEFQKDILTREEHTRLFAIKYPVDSCIVVTKPCGGKNGKENYCYKIQKHSTARDPCLYFNGTDSISLRNVQIRRATSEETARYEREGKPYDTKVSEVSNNVAMTPDGQPITNDPYAGKSLEEMLVICRQMFPKGCKYRKKDDTTVYVLEDELCIQTGGIDQKGISNIGLPWFFFNGTMRVELVEAPPKDTAESFVSRGTKIAENSTYGFIPIDTTTVVKTLKDLPKKATLSDVSALVKHQEPVIAFSKKAKRSKLVIINK